MSKDGLVATPQGTTSTPPKEMYEEMEQGEEVAKGCIEVKELIAYDITDEPRRSAPEKPGLRGEIKTNREGKTLYVENPRKPCFCQTAEQEAIFSENHPSPKTRVETFTIQLLKSTAIKFLDDPENMKQFKEAGNG